jgi:hypothetical protein
MHEMFTSVEAGELPANVLVGGAAGTGGGIMDLPLQLKVKPEHPEMLSFMTRYTEAARAPLHEQADLESAIDTDIRALPRTTMLIRRVVPAVINVGGSNRRVHAWMRTMIVCLAAERYRRAHNEWPKSASELVPTFLSAVPLDPYIGKSIRFVRVSDGYVTYAVGPDLTDDGGKLAPWSKAESPGTDTGFRVWDLKQRRQLPSGK